MAVSQQSSVPESSLRICAGGEADRSGGGTATEIHRNVVPAHAVEHKFEERHAQGVRAVSGGLPLCFYQCTSQFYVRALLSPFCCLQRPQQFF